MQLSAVAYNLKKYLKFIEKRTKSGAASIQGVWFSLKVSLQHILLLFNLPNFKLQRIYTIK